MFEGVYWMASEWANGQILPIFHPTFSEFAHSYVGNNQAKFGNPSPGTPARPLRLPARAGKGFPGKDSCRGNIATKPFATVKLDNNCQCHQKLH